jgi:hypothetical protein
MRNDAYPKMLHYTEVHDPYHGYIIEWAVSPSTAEPGRWMGHFRARKDQTETLAESIGNLQDSAQLAGSKAIEIAKARIDKAIAKQS